MPTIIVKDHQLDWFPENFTSCETQFSDREKKVLRKKKYLKPSEWAEKHRKIVKGRLAGSCMSMDMTPHLKGILDSSVLPHVSSVHICAAPQTGKTTCIDTILGWSSIYAPGPTVSFYPDEVTAKRSMKERLQPMIESSPVLNSRRAGHKDDFTATSIDLVGMSWDVGWVGSLSQTADRSLRYVDMQEVDKPSYGISKEEAGIVDLLRKRVRAYAGESKIFITSSPSTEHGNITVIMEQETESVFVFWVVCPYCHNEILMNFSESTFWWPKDVDGKSVDRKEILSKKLARYVCQSCKEKWSDYDRDKAIKRNSWRVRKLDEFGQVKEEKGDSLFLHLAKERPASIGFYVPSWISSFVSLSEIAHDFLKMTDKNLNKEQQLSALKDFKNGHESLPWIAYEEARKETKILDLRGKDVRGIVPTETEIATLIFGADTQDDGFWYSIFAVGYGINPKRYLIDEGFVIDFATLAERLWMHEFKDETGRVYPVTFGLIDSAGHRTSEVYDFCAEYSGFIAPSTGQRSRSAPLSQTQVEFYPGSEKKKFLRLLYRFSIDTTYYKDKLNLLLGIPHKETGCYSMHSEISTDYAKQLCAEYRDEKGVWNQIGNRANHQFDCAVLALAAEDYLSVRTWPLPSQAKTAPKKKKKISGSRSKW